MTYVDGARRADTRRWHGLGAWSLLRDPLAVEALCVDRITWICVDMQHGGATTGDLAGLVAATLPYDVLTLVRVPDHTPSVIGSALDAGADGVIVPTVESAAQAASVVAACRYPPDGNRSWGPVRSGLRGSARAALCVAMIENAEGLAKLAPICDAGIDGVLVGPRDLALSCGADPEAKIEQILRHCATRGLPVGIPADSVEAARRYAECGATAVSVDSDVGAIRTHLATLISNLAGSSLNSFGGSSDE